MPFDGIEYQEVPLVSRYVHHPDAPVLPALVAQSLMAAYGYCRTHAQLIGVQAHPYSTARGANLVVLDTAFQSIANFYGYIPSWATHILADVTFFVFGEAPSEANLRVITSADTSEIATIPYDHAEQGDRRFLPTRSLTPALERGLVVLELSATTLDQDVDVTVRAFATETETKNAAIFRPHITTAWWLAVG